MSALSDCSFMMNDSSFNDMSEGSEPSFEQSPHTSDGILFSSFRIAPRSSLWPGDHEKDQSDYAEALSQYWPKPKGCYGVTRHLTVNDDVLRQARQVTKKAAPRSHGPADLCDVTSSCHDVESTLSIKSASESLQPPRKRKSPVAAETAKQPLPVGPLSQITAHLTHIPIRDIETWVNRSMAERRKEVTATGVPKRPSNSFILYRSAYADRCREYNGNRNHQDISSMAGSSWQIEPPETRKKFVEWAKKEREAHQVAFPGYKFKPQNSDTKTTRKRKSKAGEESDDGAESKDDTWSTSSYMTSGDARPSTAKRQRSRYREDSLVPSSRSDEDVGTPEPFASLEDISFEALHGFGKSIPIATSRFLEPAEYSSSPQSQVLDMHEIANMDNELRCMKADASPGLYDAPMLGFRGASQMNFMGGTPVTRQNLVFSPSALDPLLFEDHDDCASVESECFLDHGFYNNSLANANIGGEEQWLQYGCKNI